MASFNKVILMGNLTRDPESPTTPSGMQITKLGIAVNRRYTTQQGEQREEVTFVDVDVFGRQAEVISRYMSKGRPILIEGRLRLDEWENQQGEKRNKMVVVCENFQFVGGGGDGEEGGGGGGYSGGQSRGGGGRDVERSSPGPRRQQQSRRASEPEPQDDLDDDVPF